MRAMQARLDRSPATAERLCQLALAEATVIAQDQHRPMFHGEPVERVPDLTTSLRLLNLLGRAGLAIRPDQRVELRLHFRQLCLLMMIVPLEVIHTDIVDDPVEPGQEWARKVKAAECGEEFDEDELGDIVGGVARLGDIEGGREDTPMVLCE